MGNSGDVALSTQGAGVKGNSGGISVLSGTTNQGDTGNIELRTSKASEGSGGHIKLKVGSGNIGNGSNVTITAGASTGKEGTLWRPNDTTGGHLNLKVIFKPSSFLNSFSCNIFSDVKFVLICTVIVWAVYCYIKWELKIFFP